jgi:tRNA/rRNA methyltransferase
MSEQEIYLKAERHSHLHVVLVEPEDNLNIGSVARAMMNLGFRNLHLVAPRHFDINRASITARWAVPLLEQAKFYGTLEEALAPMQQVVGFALRPGRNKTEYVLFPEWVTELSQKALLQTALLFGPEDTGLRNEHLDHCRVLVRIPTTQEYPAFNLAQSVLITLYELSRLQYLELHGNSGKQLPDWNQYYQLDRLVERVGTLSGFYDEDSSPHLPGLVKSLIRRIDLDEREIRVLTGLFSRVDKALSGKVPITKIEEN